jgi:hypothetical protein
MNSITERIGYKLGVQDSARARLAEIKAGFGMDVDCRTWELLRVIESVKAEVLTLDAIDNRIPLDDIPRSKAFGGDR